MNRMVRVLVVIISIALLVSVYWYVQQQSQDSHLDAPDQASEELNKENQLTEPVVSISASQSDLDAGEVQSTQSDEQSFALDDVETIDFGKLDHIAKQILALQKLPQTQLSDEQVKDLNGLQNQLYQIILKQTRHLYIESQLLNYMPYLNSEQIRKIERLRSSQANDVQ